MVGVPCVQEQPITELIEPDSELVGAIFTVRVLSGLELLQDSDDLTFTVETSDDSYRGEYIL